MPESNDVPAFAQIRDAVLRFLRTCETHRLERLDIIPVPAEEGEDREDALAWNRALASSPVNHTPPFGAWLHEITRAVREKLAPAEVLDSDVLGVLEDLEDKGQVYRGIGSWDGREEPFWRVAVAPGRGSAETDAARDGWTGSGDPSAADLVGSVIRQVDRWLTPDSRIAPITVLGGPPNPRQEKLREEDERQRASARGEFLQNSETLAVLLERFGLDVHGWLKLCEYAGSNDDVAATGLWPDVKVSLQHLRLKLQVKPGPAVRLGAGTAYVRAIENDPEARAALESAQARLRASAEMLKDPAFRRQHERARREQEQAFRAIADAIQEAVRTTHQHLGDLGFMPPKTIEDWEHLARVVEMPFETIKSGNFTARDVYVMALAWLDRQRMLSQFKQKGSGAHAQAASGRPAAAGGAGYTVAALRDMTGLENTALNRYAKTANVKTPRRGGRNFKYALADVRAILDTIIAGTAEDRVRDKCKSALRNLPEIAE